MANASVNITSNMTETIDTLIPIPVLAQELNIYKMSNYLYKYLVVPIAIWGFVGNFFSFR